MEDFDLAAALGPDPGTPQPAPTHQEVKFGEHKADTPASLPHHAEHPRDPSKSHKDGSCPHSSASSSSSSSSSDSEQKDKDLGTDHKKKKQKFKKDKKHKSDKDKKRH